jgi:radical SAM superfamily enzyme YgiQ (UPF0313 family)
MRVVLARPPVSGPKGFPVVADLGLLYLAKALQQADVPVAMRDGWLETDPHRALALDLIGHEPVLVGFKLFSLGITTVRAAARAIKEKNPHAKIAVGGPHPSGVCERLWDDVPEADFGWLGEGEIGLPLLARALDDGGDLSTIPGLVWRDGTTPRVNPAAVVDDLDTLDQPAWDLAPVQGYLRRATPIRKQPHLSILTSRGCPFDCAYCAGRLITGRRMRFRDPTLVVDEIAMLHQRHGVRQFAITDDNFSLVRRHVEGFCEALLARGLPITWDCLATGLRLDSLDEELLRLMERSGCSAASVAVESGSQRILDLMVKQSDLAVAREKIALIRRVTKMRVNSYYIIGYPDETRDDLAATVRFSRRSRAHHALFFLFTPLPGAPITERLQRENKLPPGRWEDFRYDRPSISLADVPVDALKRWQIWATFSFYFGRPWRLFSLARDLASPHVLRDFAGRLLALLRPGD